MKIIRKENLPVYLWGPDPEPEAARQIDNLSRLPFAFHHIAVMPDCHSGYGMPIGGVLAAQGFVIPNAVGVDIGCGMCAFKTSLKAGEAGRESLAKIVNNIRKTIPLGFEHHRREQDHRLMPAMPEKTGAPVARREYRSALTQLGTLGGGNHFIELQKDGGDNLWVMIHSGSRNLGKQVCDHYNRAARDTAGKRKITVPREWDLAFLPLGEETAAEYLDEMRYCVDFAFANRSAMMGKALEIIAGEFRLNEKEIKGECSFGGVPPSGVINIAHNYASLETHFGREVLVHRKGATLAAGGTLGIIPGSQGTSSYLVRGKGNPDSFNSCSHGAGRKMSRNRARGTLDLAEEVARLEAKGVLHAVKSRADLDEASGAYKDIDSVMESQKDLVEILVKLEPLAVVKG